MKKCYVITLVIFAVFFGMLLIAENRPIKMAEDSALKKVIVNKAEKSKSINFAEITDFEWDYMYVLPPYSVPKDVLSRGGVDTGRAKFNVELLDSINMIGFVNGRKLVAYVELPRNYGGERLQKPIKFSRREAEFKISNHSIIFEK